MASLLSNLASNLSEGIYEIKCKLRHNYINCEACGIKYKHCICFIEYTNFKDDSTEYKCLCCNKTINKSFMKD